MGVLVVNGASLQCDYGSAPANLIVVPVTAINGDNQPAASIQDYEANTNIPPFGSCSSLSNPSVASATSAAGGVLTSQTCTPMTEAAWSSGSDKLMIDDEPALTPDSTCVCSYGGTIQITYAGQTKVDIS